MASDLHSMRLALCALEPLFQDIAFARALDFQQEGAGLDWQQLEDAVAALTATLRLPNAR